MVLAAAALRARIAAPGAAQRRATLGRPVAARRAARGEAAFTAVWDAGQGWTLAQATSEATGLAAAVASPPS